MTKSNLSLVVEITFLPETLGIGNKSCYHNRTIS
jgi:hypothetical protein